MYVHISATMFSWTYCGRIAVEFSSSRPIHRSYADMSAAWIQLRKLNALDAKLYEYASAQATHPTQMK